MAERDVALAIKLNPEFAMRSITNRLMKFGEPLHFRQPVRHVRPESGQLRT